MPEEFPKSEIETLWAPWRVEYFKKEERDTDFLSKAAAATNDAEHLVITRRKNAFLMMNRYPYAVGHLMAVPYRKTSELSALGENEITELWALLVRAQALLRRATKAQGFNIGLNLGESAGAGVVDHLHVHIVPRWSGDTNFMPILADTRTLSEGLNGLYQKLIDAQTELEEGAAQMNATWIEPPPPQRGMGCLGRGCLIFVAFILLLAAAFTAGTFLAVRYLRTSYFVTAPVELPASNATDQELETARAKWYEFKRAARAHTAARIEMTADELNALIASEPDLRGKAFVSIEGNSARLQVSIPLSFTKLMRGRYMNAECTVKSDPDGDPADVHITSVVVNGRPVGDDVLDYRGPYGFRHYVQNWSDQVALKTFEIKNGRLILESRSSQ